MKSRVLLISLAVMLALGVGAIGCTGEYVREVTEYNLMISSTGGGTTVPELDCVCAEGTEVSIEAIPDAGYRFTGWTGDVDGIDDAGAASTTITMNGNYSILANFCEIPVTYHFEEGEMTIPNPNVGAAIRGDIGEKGYIFPSDLQRHTFFSGIT